MSSAPLLLHLGIDTCCPTVRCGCLYYWKPIEYRISTCLAVVRIFFGPHSYTNDYFHRLSLHHLLRRLPRLCLAEARYLLTGKEPRSTTQDSNLPFNITSHPEGPIFGELRDKIVTNVGLTHQPALFPELDYAMWSGWG